MSPRDDEHLWEQAALEVDGPSRRRGLWAKAFALANGSEPVARAHYLQWRVTELKEEMGTGTKTEATKSERVENVKALATSIDDAKTYIELRGFRLVVRPYGPSSGVCYTVTTSDSTRYFYSDDEILEFVDEQKTAETMARR